MAATANDQWTRTAHVSMLAVQVLYGGSHVATKAALDNDVDVLVFCVYRIFVAFCILAIIAYFWERRQRPPFKKCYILRFFLLGLTGIIGNQLMVLYGLKQTDPTYASALQPAIPVFTFFIAVIWGEEKLNIRTREGGAKLVGILLCIVGAVVMAVYQGPPFLGKEKPETAVAPSPDQPGPRPVGGILYFTFSCLFMAVYLFSQAQFLEEYPACLSMMAYSHGIALLIMAVAAAIFSKNLSHWMFDRSEIYAVCYTGVLTSAFNHGMTTWANKILGPSVVALYFPVQIIAAAFIGYSRGTIIYTGSMVGAGLCVFGLYSVQWASWLGSAETQTTSDEALEPLLGEEGSSRDDIAETGTDDQASGGGGGGGLLNPDDIAETGLRRRDEASKEGVADQGSSSRTKTDEALGVVDQGSSSSSSPQTKRDDELEDRLVDQGSSPSLHDETRTKIEEALEEGLLDRGSSPGLLRPSDEPQQSPGTP
ncbi:WAT1-related protein At3g45870-like [Andrographis paniculata]|uniref:WAT1-related protein At3g45870-like n=1 Tax=Andrographis paniculata TaxID=175694 RepID=UPI0021E8B847|nr:WAT1-related protein At3g45870-like [Andrographis paniculata]